MPLVDALPHTAVAKRRKRTAGSLGDGRDAYETVALPDSACFCQAVRQKEIEEYGKRGSKITNKIFFAADPGVDERHILEITGGGVTGTYEVVVEADTFGEGGNQIVWKVMACKTSTGSTPE